MLQITKSNNVFEVFTRKSVDFGEGEIILVKYNVTTVLVGTCLVDLHWSSYSG